MPFIDWASVDWRTVVLLSAIAFVAALIGNVISFRSSFIGAILAGILFGAGYIAWTYYLAPQGILPPIAIKAG